MAQLTITRFSEAGFSFVYEGSTPIIDDNPRLTTFGSRCDFKTSNGSQIIPPVIFSEVEVIDTFGATGTFTFSTVQELFAKLVDLNFFKGVSYESGISGTQRFDQLLDTFNYFGQDGKVPVVNESQQKLTPTTFYNYNKFQQLDDVAISQMTEGKYLSIANLGTISNPIYRVVLSDPPSSGGSDFISSIGWYDYNHGGATQPYTSGSLILQNDTAGAFTRKDFALTGVPDIWDSSTNSFDFSDLEIGDEVVLRIHLNVTTTVANQEFTISLRFAEGTASQFDLPLDRSSFKSSGVHPDTIKTTTFYIGNADVRDFPAKIIFTSDSSATVSVKGWHPFVIKKSANIVDFNFSIGTNQSEVLLPSGDTFFDLPYIPESLIMHYPSGEYIPVSDYTLNGNRVTLLSAPFLSDQTISVTGFVVNDDGSGTGVALDPTASHFKGNWNATTNAPALTNGTGQIGDEYKVSVGGTVDFGAGDITFSIGDIVAYDGAIYYKKVNNNQNGGSSTLPPIERLNSFSIDNTYNGAFVKANSLSDIIVSIDSGSVNDDNFRTIIKRSGVGQVKIQAGSGVTVFRPESSLPELSERHDALEIVRESNDVFSLFGGLKLKDETYTAASALTEVLTVSDVTPTLPSLYWPHVYKSSDFPQFTAIPKSYFGYISADHGPAGSTDGNLVYFVCDSPDLTGFEIRGVIVNGYQPETPWMMFVPSGESAISDQIFLYYHTQAEPGNNPAATQETRLLTTSGGTEPHLATWNDRGRPLGVFTGEDHTGYAKFWRRGANDYISFHHTVAGAGDYKISTATDPATGWARLANIDPVVVSEGTFTDTSIMYPIPWLYAGVRIGFTVFTDNLSVKYVAAARLDSNYRPVSLIKTIFQYDIIRDLSVYFEKEYAHILVKKGLNNSDPLYPYDYSRYDLSDLQALL